MQRHQHFVFALAATLTARALAQDLPPTDARVDGELESAALVINPARNYGDMPLIVLTATDLGFPPPGAARICWRKERRSSTRSISATTSSRPCLRAASTPEFRAPHMRSKR
jgi:hypothetical protein